MCVRRVYIYMNNDSPWLYEEGIQKQFKQTPHLKSVTMIKKIVVIGSGFAGLWTAIGAKRVLDLNKSLLDDQDVEVLARLGHAFI